MLKHLRHWHFDIALFLGLAIFTWAYWYSLPMPVMRIGFKPTDYVSLAGFSTDSQSVLVMHHGTLKDSHSTIPRIERWDIINKRLDSRFELQVPDYDRKLLQASPKSRRGIGFSAITLPPTECLYCYLVTDPNKPERILRLYDSKTGECLTAQHQFKSPYVQLLTNTDLAHPLSLANNLSNDTVDLIDLSDGTIVHRFQYDSKRRTVSATVSTDQKLLLVSSIMPIRTASYSTQVNIYRMGTWELLQSLTVECKGNITIMKTDSDRIVLTDIVSHGDTWSSRFITYRYVPSENKYQLDEQSLLNRNVKPHARYWLQDNLIIEHEIVQASLIPLELEKKVNRLLDRFGKMLWRPPVQQQFHVYDAQSGQLLRQITGIVEHGNTFLRISPDSKYLIGNHYYRDNGSTYELCIYQVPHYLWEHTLSWMQWLAWLLVIPWPLRYFLYQS